LIHRLGGCLLYLVKGRLQTYECIDGVGSTITDERLREFLAGEGVTATS